MIATNFWSEFAEAFETPRAFELLQTRGVLCGFCVASVKRMSVLANIRRTVASVCVIGIPSAVKSNKS